MMKSNYITAYLIRVDADGQQYQGYLSEVENSYEYKKQYVDGDIEIIPMHNNMVIICKQDAVVLGVPLNRAVYDENGAFVTVLSGNIMVLKQGDKEFTSICEDAVSLINQCLKPIVRIYNGIIDTKPVSTLPEWNK